MIDLEVILRFSFALAVVLALIALLAWIARTRFGARSLGLTRKPRLAVLETATIDARTRLVLVRRDDAEHLIVVGTAGIASIESGIRSLPIAPVETRSES